MKIRKKPIVVEAFTWNGQSRDQWPIWAQEDERISDSGSGLYVYTLEGSMRCNKGDTIIKGVKNELYPIKPEILAETYDIVEE